MARKSKDKGPCRFALVDALEAVRRPTIDDYVRAASEYIRYASDKERNGKSAQIKLSASLAGC